MVTYLAFDAVAFLLPVVALALVCRRSLSTWHIGTLGLLVPIIVVYATPWDNYLVSRGIWSYGEGVVHARIGRVPLGEYAVFVLQPLLVGLWFYRLGPEIAPDAGPAPFPSRAVGPGVWFAFTLAGGTALTTEQGWYLGALCVWICPVLALEWAFGGPALWRDRRLLVRALVAPTLYLWVVDAVAISLGVWTIDPATTVGLAFGPLVLEEALFFFLTTLALAQGFLLGEWIRARIQSQTAPQ